MLKMFLQLLLICIFMNQVRSQSTAANCSKTAIRIPDYNDIAVECGTNSMSLAVQICPAVFAGFNESLLFVNGLVNDPNCKGTVDNSVNPPVLRFTVSLGANNCGSTFLTTSAQGTGVFSDFSSIQTLNISGVVRSYDPSVSVVTYNTDLKYFYSCAYPLQYLLNNTQLDVSTSAIAVRDRNGSFVSTLSLKLFSDANYTTPLSIPTQGIEVKSNVFVQVQAINLTSQYYVLLDRCYASVSRYPNNSTFYNLFVGCSKDQQTNITDNGVSQSARFVFPAFRFTEQRNMTSSRYYLHCITRLCESSACSLFRTCPARRKRDVGSTSDAQDGVTETTTLTSPLIITKSENSMSSPGSTKEQALPSKAASDPSVGLGVAVGVLVFACVGMIAICAAFYKKVIVPGPTKMLPK
ncbi:zona pellucida-like domain-containing protein 1 [Trichomycterus rosablanca]|uniref:zona pellucida-like domain-containing protein 1 n=1 Tax=Trichomycterus rosablanca TaxID=2290929 RepID=UPI002F35F1F3